MIAIDLEKKKVLMDEEIRAAITEKPLYRTWCDTHLVNLHKFAAPSAVAPASDAQLPTLNSQLPAQLAFGYDLDESSSSSRRSPRALSPPARWVTTRRSPCSRAGAPAVFVFQAALRAGHKSADRLDPRKVGHVAHDVSRRPPRPLRGTSADEGFRRARHAHH